MMKLGEEKMLARGTMSAWGHEIERVWLCKNMNVKQYQIWGLCVDFAEDGTRLGARGWCTLFSGNLKEARAYARAL